MSINPRFNRSNLFESIDRVPSMSISQTIDAARDIASKIPADEPFTAFSAMQIVQDAKELSKKGSVEHERLESFQGSFRIALREKWPKSSF